MANQTPDITAILDAGYRLHKAGKFREAEQHYKQVLAIDPENAEAWQLWGHIAGASKNHHAAAELMRRSLSHDPGQPEVWLSYAKLLIEIREDDLAVKALEEATRLRPDYAEAHFNLGVAMISAGRPKEAPKHLESALSAQPVYPEVSRVLASLGAIKPGSGYFKAIEDQLANDDLEASKGAHLHYALAIFIKKRETKRYLPNICLKQIACKANAGLRVIFPHFVFTTEFPQMSQPKTLKKPKGLQPPILPLYLLSACPGREQRWLREFWAPIRWWRPVKNYITCAVPP